VFRWSVGFPRIAHYFEETRATIQGMAKEIEETEYEDEGTETADYVTREELSAAIADALRDFMGGGSDSHGDEDDGWVDIDLDEMAESVSMTAADIERIAEQKVREAMRTLGAKKTTAKKAAPVKKAAPKVEAEPTQPGKKSLRGFLWGEN